MRNVLTIASREFIAYFTSPMAYVAMLFYLGLSGLIFVLANSIGNAPPKADIGPLSHSLVFLLLFLAPVITMGLLSQEFNSGTYEMLMTKPVRDAEVVVGKWLGASGLVTLILLITFEFPLLYEAFGQPAWAPTLVNYLGIFLCGLTFSAVGIFASSVTSNQIAAWLIGTFMLLFFWLVGYLALSGTTLAGDIAKFISTAENFDDFGRGVLDLKNVVYFLSVTFYFLFLSVRSLESRRTV